MCKRVFLYASFILLVAAAPSVLANPIGVFDFSQDIGTPGDPWTIGYTTIVGNDYIITAGGSDIWGTADHFHYAYKEVAGDVRLSFHPEWHLGNKNDWAKIGAMIREDTSAGSVHYNIVTRRGAGDAKEQSQVDNYVSLQFRPVKDGGSTGLDWWGKPVDKIAIQRLNVQGADVVQALVDEGTGAGWELVATQLVSLPETVMVGASVTSHQNDNDPTVQARLTDVVYDFAPELVGIPTVTPDSKVEPCSDISGFVIRSIKADPKPDNWGWDGMNDLLDGLIPGTEEGKRIEQFVNLYDSGGRGAFEAANGFEDQSFPGIDPFEQPASDPAAGDNDDNFATEVIGCIELTAGLHVIGANSDDGTVITIGGVEVGRTGEWKGASNVDFVYNVLEDGVYPLVARSLEGGGGASLELHEVLLDGTRLLLNDVANGGSPVYAPEPATIALLGLGGLALLRRKR